MSAESEEAPSVPSSIRSSITYTSSFLWILCLKLQLSLLSRCQQSLVVGTSELASPVM